MMSLIAQWLQNPLLKAFCWTLIHSLWQGLLAAAIAGLIIISSRHTAARLRYKLLVSVMALFFIGTAFTFYWQLDTVSVTKTAVIRAGELYGAPGDYTIASPKATASTFTYKALDRVNAWYPVIMCVWIIFFAIKNVKLITGLHYMHRIRRQQTSEPPAYWKEKMQSLAKTLGVHPPVKLLESTIVKVPVAIGYFKPVILIPLGMLANLPADQAESILLHELAHTMRKDYLANLLQYMMEAIFFFNPAILWISSLIREEREACCDDIVLANTTNTRAYFDALVSFHEFNTQDARMAMALGRKRMHLLDRVKRMLTRENKKLNRAEKLFLALGLVAVMAFGFVPRPETLKRKNTRTAKKETVTQKPSTNKAVKNSSQKISRQLTSLRADTVPSATAKKEIISYDSIYFSTIKFDITNSPDVKKKHITAIDNKGRTFVLVQDGEQVQSFSINGENIPAAEFGNHAELFERLNDAIAASSKQKRERMEEKIAKDRVIREVELSKAENAQLLKKMRQNDEQSKQLLDKLMDKKSQHSKEGKARDEELLRKIKENNKEADRLLKKMLDDDNANLLRKEVNAERKAEQRSKEKQIDRDKDWERKQQFVAQNTEQKKLLDNFQKMQNDYAKQEALMRKMRTDIDKEAARISKQITNDKQPAEPNIAVPPVKSKTSGYEPTKAKNSAESHSSAESEGRFEIDGKVTWENSSYKKFDSIRSWNANKKFDMGSELRMRSLKLAQNNRSRLFQNNRSRLFQEKDRAARNGYNDQQQRVKSLIDDLIKAKVISSIDALDYIEFSAEELVVNGVKQPAELHRSLKGKYGIRPKYGIFYGNTPNGGTGIIFEKKDLF
jgi:bla regulator protein blaR1